MKKIAHILAKIVFSLILLLPVVSFFLMPFGMIPEPTQDYYNTPEAFAFIQAISDAGYITAVMTAVHVLALVALWTRREALAALLVLPITVNIVGFHAVLDGGLFTAGALLGNIMLIINLYLLWKHRKQLQVLINR